MALTKKDLTDALSKYATKEDLKREIKENVDILRVLIEDNNEKLDKFIEFLQPKVVKVETQGAAIENHETRITVLEDVVRVTRK